MNTLSPKDTHNFNRVEFIASTAITGTALLAAPSLLAQSENPLLRRRQAASNITRSSAWADVRACTGKPCCKRTRSIARWSVSATPTLDGSPAISRVLRVLDLPQVLEMLGDKAVIH